MKKLTRRWVAAGLALTLSGLGGAFFLLGRDRVETVVYRSPDPRQEGAPRSESAIVLKPYRFFVGHCGLTHIVDFDGSYWEVDASTLTEEEEGRFGINGDVGTMTLVDADIADYRSSSGGEATLRRHRGALERYPCA